MKPKDQKRILVEVVQRVLESQGKNPALVEATLLETLYEEKRRLEANHQRAKKEWPFYHRIQSLLLHADVSRQRELLIQVIRHFAEEVLGHFSEAMYRVATQIVPVGLNLLLNTLSPLRLLRELPKGLGQLDDQIKLDGHYPRLQKLAKQGTVILVPTHVSNLDSLLIGYVLYRLKLPPFLYGAGLNLFSSKFMGFFMDRLGAYKVDRRKKAPLYKQVLKTYAGYSMELGYHNLFFPGGTRSRSGTVEKKLKLGLLGMGLDAYIHNLLSKKKHPDIFVVPCTLNYQLVLEAQTLMEDHLKEVGKSRYIIEDDEFAQLKRILEFLTGLFSLESRIHVVFSEPLDVFGNVVDARGHSHDPRGRPIDRKRYVLQRGRPTFDPQRDQEYTHELSEQIVRSYERDTVISSVALVSQVVLAWLQEENPDMDLYRLLRTGGRQSYLELPEAYRRMEATLKSLQTMERQGQIRLDETLHQKDPVAIFSEALAHLKSYHRHPVLERKGDRLFPWDRSLLLYYQNRVPKLEVGR